MQKKTNLEANLEMSNVAGPGGPMPDRPIIPQSPDTGASLPMRQGG